MKGCAESVLSKKSIKMRFGVLFYYFTNVFADYLVDTGYPTSNCQGTPYAYVAQNVNPCTVPFFSRTRLMDQKKDTP